MRSLKFFPLIIAVILIYSVSCEKDNNPDGRRLRIKKIADNQAMENPITFEYNSKGLLVKVNNIFNNPNYTKGFLVKTEKTYDNSTYKTWMSIKYNTSNQPIELWQTTEMIGGDAYVDARVFFSWDSYSYSKTNLYLENLKHKYNLSSDNQLESIVTFERETDLSAYDTIELSKIYWYR
jgi:hypothetical protein